MADVKATLVREYQRWVQDIIAANPGLTATDMARQMGLAHSTISRQLLPTNKNLPSIEVLRAISTTWRKTIPKLLIGDVDASGFAEPDAVPIAPEIAPGEDWNPNQSDWEIRSTALAAMGCMPGDTIRFDASIAPVAGDIVIAQIYRPRSMEAETVMRHFLPPYLVAAEFGAPSIAPIEIDPTGERVQIMGTMIKRWRLRKLSQASAA